MSGEGVRAEDGFEENEFGKNGDRSKEQLRDVKYERSQLEGGP